MTPKEKSIEIFDKYFEQMLSFGFHLSNSQIKQLALIAVDEILNSKPVEEMTFLNGVRSNIPYWQEVKQEIEKL